MRTLFRGATFIALVVILLNCQQARAASMSGKVIEINDGDEITIFNLNRPVRIKLIGIDAPEKDQEFGAAAKQHLFDLVYDKFVSVEYFGIGQHSSLIGRVLLNDSDINAQMIRDGAAWFDPSYKTELSETQTEIYYQSEQAARSEKRGLWQTNNAVAPWDFVKAEQLKKKRHASVPSTQAEDRSRAARPIPELTSIGLLPTGTALPKARSVVMIESSDTRWITEGPFRKTWKRFKPAGENFSALLPNDGEQGSKPIPFGARTFDINYYRARDGYSFFEVVWFSGPVEGETDDFVLKLGLNMILQGVGGGSEENSGRKFECEPRVSEDISYSGYSGREFDLSRCTIPGIARIYTKVIGDHRQLYLGFSFYREDDANINKFIKSFAVTEDQNEVPKPKVPTRRAEKRNK